MYLHWFTGNKKGNKDGVPRDIGLVLEDIDKWVSYFESFKRNTPLPSIYYRRALYDRMTGNTKEYLLPYENNVNYSLAQLVYGLRLHYSMPKTRSEIASLKRAFTQEPR